MAADDFEYGWYKWENGFRQKDGFFTDRAGNILYWPTEKGPGRIMDARAIETIHEDYVRKDDYYSKVKLTLAIISILSYISVLRFSCIEHIRIIHVYVIYFIYILIFKSVNALSRSSHGSVDLSHLPLVSARRPPDRDHLIVAKADTAISFWGRCLFWAAITAGLIYLSTFIFEKDWEISISGIAVQLGLSLVVLLPAVAVAADVVTRIRARFSPYALQYLVSRILVGDGLTLRMLMATEDEPMPAELLRSDADSRQRRRSGES